MPNEDKTKKKSGFRSVHTKEIDLVCREKIGEEVG